MNTLPIARASAGLLLAGGLVFAGPVVVTAQAAEAVAPVAGHSVQTASSAAEQTTWALRPGEGAEADGRVSLRHTIDPGAKVSDTVVLTNFGERAATFALFASDGAIGDDGNFTVVEGDAAVDSGTWIALKVKGGKADASGRTVVKVPAAASRSVSVTMRAPENATPGDHPAGIVAELVPPDDSSVQLASRVGVRAHVRVSGDIAPSLEPRAVSATYEPSWNPFAPGHVTIDYALENGGNIRLGANSETALAGPAGLAGATAAADVREILPGTSAPASQRVSVWPTVFTWGSVSATPVAVGEDEVDAPLADSAASFTVWTVPWSQLALVVVVVGGVLLVVRMRRGSRDRVQQRIDAAVAAATAERSAAPPSKAPSSPASSNDD